MAQIKPFRAIRPAIDWIEKIAELPYDVYNREEARKLVENRPDSFLAIDRPETQFAPDYDMYASEVYQMAHTMLWNQVEEGRFIQEATPCYYIYRLIMDGRSQTGLVGCASIDDYQNGVIKKHENTRADKEQDRIRHVDTCEAQTGPIFLAYRYEKRIGEIVASHMNQETPVYDFIKDGEIRHTVWVIKDEEQVSELEKCFQQLPSVYIADGHHRCASAVKVGLRRRETEGISSESDYFLSVLFPDKDLMIMDYNRVVMDLNGLSEEEFLTALSKCFFVEKAGNGDTASDYQKPSQKGEFGMFLAGDWYRLNVREEYSSIDPVAGLDVSVLQNCVLDPILGITDPKTDKRIDFVGGIRGMKELERRVNEGCAVAFSLYPTSIRELFEVADAGRLMPPKSTWFEPKLLSGIFIHDIRKK